MPLVNKACESTLGMDFLLDSGWTAEALVTPTRLFLDLFDVSAQPQLLAAG